MNRGYQKRLTSYELSSHDLSVGFYRQIDNPSIVSIKFFKNSQQYRFLAEILAGFF